MRTCGPIVTVTSPGHTRITDDSADDQAVPDEQHDERADRCGDESRTLVRPIPAGCLPDERRQKGTDNPEYGGEDEAGWIVRPGRQETGDETGDESDNDDPDEARHDCLPS